MTIQIFTTGGTFDKVYFDALSEYQIGEPVVADLLREANVDLDYSVVSLLKKDSLEMTDEDRETIRAAIAASDASRVLLIHGTDTMVDTAKVLSGIEGKTIVLFGAMQPARLRFSDAMFNLGAAFSAVQLLPAGVHLVMNGRIFDPREVRKNRARGRFESTPADPA